MLFPATIKFPVMLSPMAGITEQPFRLLCKQMGCDFVFTEMISAKGLTYNNTKTIEMLKKHPGEDSIGLQLFGSDPDNMAMAVELVIKKHPNAFLVIDINMGCPAHKIVSNGEGAALMKNPYLASKIIKAAIKASNTPVTVKIRKGWDDESVNAIEFAIMAQESGAYAICVHGRTRQQQYSGKADWDIIGKVKDNVDIPVWGNGDIFCANDALLMRKHTNCDGVMVGRGALGNPFIFREIKAALNGELPNAPTINERFETLLRHIDMQEELKGPHALLEMRKHAAWYTKSLHGSSALRAHINKILTLDELKNYLRNFT